MDVLSLQKDSPIGSILALTLLSFSLCVQLEGAHIQVLPCAAHSCNLLYIYINVKGCVNFLFCEEIAMLDTHLVFQVIICFVIYKGVLAQCKYQYIWNFFLISLFYA